MNARDIRETVVTPVTATRARIADYSLVGDFACSALDIDFR